METANHECYVSLEVAKLLEKAGFDWVCRGNCVDGDVFTDGLCGTGVMNNSEFSVLRVPSLNVTLKWLREVKNCYVSVVADCDSLGVFYTVRIIYYDTDNNYHATYVWEETELERVKHRLIFNNYEDA